jgi:3-oxoacyl-[acyl-carrier protein] reductase
MSNPVVLITGALTGIGRATAAAFAKDGAQIVVSGRRDPEGKALVSADLATPDGAHMLAAQVRNLIGDRLDIFVSNAGISNAATFENMTVKDFDILFAVNCSRPLLPRAAAPANSA